MMTDVAKLNIGNVTRDFQYRKGTGDEAVIAQVLSNGCYNVSHLRRGKDLFDLYERFVGAGKVPLIIDATAKIGAGALYFSCLFPKARVVALEPEQANFELLTANTIGLPVKCLRGQLGSMGAAPESCFTMNDLLAQHGQDAAPFIAKIDIESGKGDLFAANTEWVVRTPAVIVELRDCLIPGTSNVHRFVEYMADGNHDFIYFHDNIFSIDRNLGAF